MNIEKADEVNRMCLQVSQVSFCILSFRSTICVTHFAIKTNIHLHVRHSSINRILLSRSEHKSFDAMLWILLSFRSVHLLYHCTLQLPFIARWPLFLRESNSKINIGQCLTWNHKTTVNSLLVYRMCKMHIAQASRNIWNICVQWIGHWDFYVWKIGV